MNHKPEFAEDEREGVFEFFLKVLQDLAKMSHWIIEQGNYLFLDLSCASNFPLALFPTPN